MISTAQGWAILIFRAKLPFCVSKHFKIITVRVDYNDITQLLSVMIIVNG